MPTIEDYWIEIYAEMAASRKAKRFENHAQALDDRWYDVVAFRIGDTKLSRVAILFNDITEKKRAESELRISEARLANALSIAALGTLIDASEKACALGSRKTHALTIVGLGPEQQVLDFVVVREGLEPSTSAL